MAYTKAEIEALKNALLASNQPITASIHRTFAQKLIDELYDAQSRGNLLSGVQASGTTGTEDSVLVIRSGQAYLIPASLFGGSGITLADLNGVVIIDPQDGDLIAYDAVSETWNNIPLAFVPYTGATANVDLGAFSLTAAALIKDGGVSSQFLKADGSVDNNNYLTANDLPSTLSLYATNVAAAVMGYFKLVASIDDPDYNTVPVDVPTGAITGAGQLIASLVSPVNLINGNPGVFNVTTTGNITRTAGSGMSEFYFEIYKRDAGGTETLVGTSGNTLPVINAGYSEFFATAIWNDGIFGVTDSIVLKFYANRIVGGSDPSYQFQFGGDQPVRTIVPVPLAVIPNIYLEELADVEDGAASDADGIFWDTTAELWKYKSLAENGAVTITDVQTITGAKTFNNELLILSGNNPVLRLASTSNTSALDFRNVFGEDKASVLLNNPSNKLSVITRTDNADIEIAPHGTGSILLPNVPAGTGDVLMLNGSNEVVKGSSTTPQKSFLLSDTNVINAIDVTTAGVYYTSVLDLSVGTYSLSSFPAGTILESTCIVRFNCLDDDGSGYCNLDIDLKFGTTTVSINSLQHKIPVSTSPSFFNYAIIKTFLTCVSTGDYIYSYEIRTTRSSLPVIDKSVIFSQISLTPISPSGNFSIGFDFKNSNINNSLRINSFYTKIDLT